MNLCFEITTKRRAKKGTDTLKSQVSGMVFRTYSELDLYELEEINTQLREKSGKIPKIDP